MAFVGMDTDLATTQATSLQTQGSDALTTLIGQLDSLLGQIAENWKGTDSGNFHNEWLTSHRVQLTNVQTALSTFKQTFDRNIQDQVATSSS